jgi:hypothetical protein
MKPFQLERLFYWGDDNLFPSLLAERNMVNQKSGLFYRTFISP